MMTDTRIHDDTAIRAVLTELSAALEAKDVDRILAGFVENPARYSLAPPLVQGPDTEYGTRAGLRNWLATFDGPVLVSHRDPVITADGDVAFVHALTSMTATEASSGEEFSFWYRTTFGLRRIDGSWRIAHEHESTPFYMDGSFLAATDLQP